MLSDEDQANLETLMAALPVLAQRHDETRQALRAFGDAPIEGHVGAMLRYLEARSDHTFTMIRGLEYHVYQLVVDFYAKLGQPPPIDLRSLANPSIN